MTLTETELKNLQCLHDLCPTGQVIELDTDRQVGFWTGMQERGYARVTEKARCGAEGLRGHFVTLTEAGRDLASR